MSRGIGLIVRFGLNKIDKLGVFAEKLYNDVLRDNQARIDKIRNLNSEIPLSLSNHKSEVVRIFGQIQGKAGSKNFQDAADQFNSELLPLLDTAVPEADEHIRKRHDYDTKRPPVATALDDLKKHAQKAHVNDKITAAQTYLDDAADDARLGDLDSALDGVKNAKTECTQGKEFADKFAAYVVKRAKAGAVFQAVKDLIDDLTVRNNLNNELVGADNLAGVPNRNYVQAGNKADGLWTALKNELQRAFVTEVRPKIQDVKDKVAGKPTAATLIDPEIKEIDKLQAEVEANLNVEKWNRAIFAGKSSVSSLITTASKLADRRIAFDAERGTAVSAIDSLKTHKTLLGQMFSMNKLVEKADGLATRAAMRFEDGIAELKNIAANCQELLKVAADAKAYNDARVDADQKLEALKKLPAAGNLANQIAAIEQQLKQADKLTGDVETVGGHKIVSDHDAGSQDWKAATTVVKQAVSDMTAAEGLAAELAGATQAQAAAATAGNAGEINKVIEDLRKQAEAASKKPHADLASHEFSHITSSLDEAADQAASGQLEIAKIPLQGAAELLLTAQTVQREHTQFLEQHKLIDDRVKALNALTDPTPDKIQAKINAITTALAEATKQDKDRAWNKSAAALHQAENAAAEAELIAQLRKQFDARAKLAETARNTLTDNTLKAKVLQTLTKATEQATQFRFDVADKGLGTAEAQIASARAGVLARTNAASPEFLAKAKDMLKAEGGEKLIDDLIKNLPDTEEAMKAMVVLAKERFGIELASDAGFKPQAARKMLEMMAKVPQQAKGNPSLKKVERREPGKNGGFYQSDENLVVMNGRPGRIDQTFGANLLNAEGHKQLPDDVPDAYKPTSDAPLDYFDFATLHEVGHAVDDRMRFMESREEKAEFGGWKTYGGNIEPIAKAVAKAKSYDSTPEQIEYVTELILGNSPEPPTPPTGQEAAWAEGLQKVKDWYAIATNEKVWWSQADSAAIEIGGTIYHEAYKKSWVSYLASERKKGMTGYQFRAPGEWFAELYACFHSGKLKNGHPAMKWIKSLAL